MSLINQMLQDLEKRGQTGEEVPAPRYTQFSNQAAAAAHPWRWRLVLLALLAIALIWVFAFQSRTKSLPSQANVVVPTLASPVLAPSQPSEPTLPLLGDLSLKLSKDVDVNRVNDNSLTSSSGDHSLNDQASIEGKGTSEPPRTIVSETARHTEKSLSSASPSPKEAPTQKENSPSKSIAAMSLTSSTSVAPVAIVKESSPIQRAESEYRQASTYLQQGRQAEALAAFQQVLKLDAQHAPARQALISLLLENNRQEDAMRELKQGLALDPNNSNFAMLLARLQVERANVNEAIITLQSGLPAGQERPDYLAFLAALKQKTGAHKEAIQLYRQALKKHANNAVWWMGLGISLQADGATQDAIDAYKQAKTQPGLSAELHAFVEQKIAGLQK